MRRRLEIVGAATATVLLALWVTAAADRVRIVKPRPKPTDDEIRQQLEDRSLGAPPGTQPDDSHQVPGWVDGIVTVVSVLFVAVILGALFWAGVEAFRRRRRFRESRTAVVVPEHDAYNVFLDDARHELEQEAERQLARIREGEPRNAIVACWIALEDAVERAGIPRDTSETPTEFTRRVMGLITLDDRAVTELGRLYREARFSRHDLTEEHRDRAITLLTQLSGELARVARPSPVTAGPSAPVAGGQAPP